MIRVSVVGATGYTGRELIKILLRHPQVKIVHVTSENSAGEALGSVHPELRNRTSLTLEAFHSSTIAVDTDLAFFALPHAASAGPVAAFLKKGRKVVDLSADFRLKNVATYAAWYKVKHPAPDLVKQAVYGLPELYRDRIRKAALIANPGCYATTTILALTPLLRQGLVDPKSLVVDAKSGVSGAGKKPSPQHHYPEVAENFQAYAVAQHRHTPEIEQVLSDQARRGILLTFVPHLLPMDRGILVTAYGRLKPRINEERVRRAFEEAYGREPFIRLLPPGVWPQTKAVANSNYVDINTKVDTRNGRVVVLAALDNLVKGASGQAVQNMNLQCGFPETEGLIN